MSTPIVMYTFDYNATTDSTVTNEGSLGTGCNGQLNNVAKVQITSDASSPTGSNCLLITVYDSSGYMTVPSILFCTNSWAICFYYRIPSLIGTTENYALFSTNELSLRLINNGCLYLTINGNNFPVCASSICDGNWRHLAITYNSTTTTYSMYFNGIMCTYPIITTAVLSSTTRNVYIGDATFSTSNLTNTTYFYIDDFRIYDNTVLTINDIAGICGNNHMVYNTTVLVNTLFNSYIPNTTKAGISSLYTRLGKNNVVNLQDLYAKSMSHYGVQTGFNKWPFSPTDITGCGLFLEADSIKNFTLNNGNVYQWTDLSGKGCHAVQSTVANQPLYQTSDSYINNKPCVYFDGVSSAGLTATCPSLPS